MYPVYKEAMIEKNYENAKEVYASLGVDVSKALDTLKKVRISMHCWQGDDVGGFENPEAGLSGGIMATGAYPGKARNPDELRQDIDKAFSLIPGKHRLNLHAIYLENNGKFVDRDEVELEHFSNWLDWAKSNDVKLDFNPTFFSHPKSESGFTLSNRDESIRKFWIGHAKRCRKIASEFARELDDKTVLNYWVPDGSKDYPADRWSPRERLAASYDEIFSTPVDSRVKEAVEGKLFGIGSEEYVVGSNDFYMAYAVSRKKLICLDMGHYHPEEVIYDKVSAALTFLPEVLIHVSRGIHWDSDHIVVLNEGVINLMREIVRGNALDRVYLAPDFFDASVNRVGAWVIGMRNIQKALLFALLEPIEKLKQLEIENRKMEVLAVQEEAKSLPCGAIWDYFCFESGVPAGTAWLNETADYEKNVLLKRH